MGDFFFQPAQIVYCYSTKSVVSHQAPYFDLLMGILPLRGGMTSSRPLGYSPVRIYVAEMGYNCVYDAIKSFWPKPLLPTACL